MRRPNFVAARCDPGDEVPLIPDGDKQQAGDRSGESLASPVRIAPEPVGNDPEHGVQRARDRAVKPDVGPMRRVLVDRAQVADASHRHRSARQPPQGDGSRDQRDRATMNVRSERRRAQHQHEANAEHDRPHVQLRSGQNGRSRPVLHQADDDEDQTDQHRRGPARHQVELAPPFEHRSNPARLARHLHSRGAPFGRRQVCAVLGRNSMRQPDMLRVIVVAAKE